MALKLNSVNDPSGCRRSGELTWWPSISEKTAIVAAVREHVWPLLAAGQVRPVVDREVPMSAAAAAHRLVEASGHVGKVLLVVP